MDRNHIMLLRSFSLITTVLVALVMLFGSWSCSKGGYSRKAIVKQYVHKFMLVNIDKKERNCLKCGKKIVGRLLCNSCFKYNSTLDDVLSRHEIHEFSMEKR
jgi:hypothetical protein